MIPFHYSRLLQKHFFTYLFPPLLTIINYFLFNFFVSVFSRKEGYLAGMFFYWIVFCIIPVLLWISKKSRRLLFRVRKLNWWQAFLIILPLIVAFSFGSFKNNLAILTTTFALPAILFSLINAFCSEFLWRGLYMNYNQANFFYAVIVPSIWFGIWHYVLLSVQPAAIGNFEFILVMIGMGLCWGVVTYFTRSVFWSFVSHALVDLSGFGMYYLFM